MSRFRVALAPAKVGNGRLTLDARELADLQRLVSQLTSSLQLRLPRGLEVVQLEVEVGRRPAHPARSRGASRSG